jgi:hypothetical protein
MRYGHSPIPLGKLRFCNPANLPFGRAACSCLARLPAHLQPVSKPESRNRMRVIRHRFARLPNQRVEPRKLAKAHKKSRGVFDLLNLLER